MAPATLWYQDHRVLQGIGDLKLIRFCHGLPINKHMRLHELFQQQSSKPSDIHWEQYPDYDTATFEFYGSTIEIVFLKIDPFFWSRQIDMARSDLPAYDIEFTVDGTNAVTGQWGSVAPKLLTAITAVIEDYFTKHPWSFITFSGMGGKKHTNNQDGTGSRVKLYQAMSKIFAARHGAKVQSKLMKSGGTVFVIFRPAE